MRDTVNISRPLNSSALLVVVAGTVNNATAAQQRTKSRSFLLAKCLNILGVSNRLSGGCYWRRVRLSIGYRPASELSEDRSGTKISPRFRRHTGVRYDSNPRI